MTILNDKEIRQRCLVPTHGTRHGESSSYYTKIGDLFYSLATGKGYNYPDPESVGIYPIDGRIPDRYARRMITPFQEKLSEIGKISYGLSSFGYDATLGPKLKIAKQKNVEGIIFDPKNVDADVFEDFEGESFIIPPHGFALGYTNEVFDIPDDVLSICMAKSTYARGALIVGVTPLEPGWRGQVTLEFSNTLDVPIILYANEGVVQFLFFQGNDRPDVTYNERGGKYMDQEGIVLSRILQA